MADYTFHFLVDVNLPKYFRFFNHPNFAFVADMDLRMEDKDIWQYATDKNLVILTKDNDFYDKFLLTEKSPKIVHFQIGNATLKELGNYFEANWFTIIARLVEHDFIIAHKDEVVF